MSIQAIDRTSVHRLTSGQVVINLESAVKELVENALDAGATSIKVTFREHGLEAIEVEDNGKGIDKADWDGIALKHHTSKLTTFSDLASVSTLGFRGEALSSLCGTATLSMVTATALTAPAGTNLTFASSGKCIVGGKVARNKGTTVKVERLFENLPVRRKDLTKNAKREFGKALELIQAYAIINTGVRFEVKNAMKGRGPQVHLQTPAAPTIRSTFSCVYTPKALPSLLDLDLTLEVATEKSVLKRVEGAVEGFTTVRVRGLISKPSSGDGRTASNRQFYYVNGRPFASSKVTKAVNEVYKSFNPNQFPTVVADFQLATDAYDVNVSPDKRTIFLHSEGNLIAALKTALEEFFQPSQSTYAMKQIGPAKKASSSAAGSSSAPAGSPSSSQREQREGTTQADGEEEEEDRPRKRRKSSPFVERTPRPGGKAALGAGDFGLANEDGALLSDDGPGAAATSMDVELDASFLSQPDPHLDSSSNPFAAFDLPTDENGDTVLPEPPSPLRRAFPTPDPTSDAAPSIPRPSSAAPDPSISAADTPNHALEAGPSSPSPPPNLASTLFRSSPPPPDSTTLSSAPRSPSPAPIRQPLIPGKLSQPKLSFGAAGVKALGKRAGKGKGKEPAKALASQLQRFVRGSQQKTQPEEAEDDEEDAEEDEKIEEAVDAEPQDEGQEEDGETPDGAPQREKEEKEETRNDDHVGAADQTAQPEEDDDDVVIEEPAEVVAASCACVHGSQLDGEDDDSDLEISEPAKEAQTGPAEPAALPFGGAAAEVAGTIVAADASLAFDLDALEAEWSSSSSPTGSYSSARRLSSSRIQSRPDDTVSGAGIDQREEDAEAALSRSVSKEDFGRMEVLGQFNLGFIIARLRVPVRTPPTVTRKWKERAVVSDDEEDEQEEVAEAWQDDLFIIDQHASDEKYNFETLQAETVIQSQRLLAPRVLNLPSHDEITAMEHLDLLRLNGFDVVVDEEADVGERVKLLAQPVSKNTVFDVGDFEELLDLISSRTSSSEIVRPSKARKMFASRACRKSVMIGKALNVKQMTGIVRHMGGMEQPWACPHGRPTMRWLFGLNSTTSTSSTTRDSRANLTKVRRAYEDE
ncbi:hypothetical protein JCM8097_003443 [Rhodosporidiobolus ruineniae]